jgi:serine/threonine protein kinase
MAQPVVVLMLTMMTFADLSLENVLLRLPQEFNTLTPEQLFEIFGEPDREPVHRLDGQPLGPEVPEEVVFPTWLGKASEQITIPEVNVLVSDFDEAFIPLISRRAHSNAAIASQPPEAQFTTTEEPLSYPADIWSLGCLIWSIVGERPLFESWIASRDELLDEQVNLLGKLPPEWWERWEARGLYWTEDGDGIRLEPTTHPNNTLRQDWRAKLEWCIQVGRRQWGMELMSHEEMVDFLDLMKAMITLRPADRPSAQQVWSSRWIQNWCLPPPTSDNNE